MTSKRQHEEREAYQVFLETRAIRKGHFELSSGRHADTYISKHIVFKSPILTSRLAGMIAHRIAHIYIETVLGPESGGAILAEYVAPHLRERTGRVIPHVSAYKTDGGGFEIREADWGRIFGRRVLVVDDIVMTGGSLTRTIEAAHRAGGSVVVVGALWNRGEIILSDIDPIGNILVFDSLISRSVGSWEPPCPQYREGIPLDPTPRA